MQNLITDIILTTLFTIILYKCFKLFFKIRYNNIITYSIITVYIILDISGSIFINYLTDSPILENSFKISLFETILDFIFISIVFHGKCIKKIAVLMTSAIIIPCIISFIFALLNTLMNNNDYLKIYYSDNLYMVSLVSYFCIFILYEKFYNNKLSGIDMHRRLEYYTYQSNLYSQTVDNIKELHKLRHDFKNHLITINSLAKNNDIASIIEYTDTLSNNLTNTFSIIETSNPSLSAILTYKNNICVANHINLSINLKYIHINIAPIDLTIILGNILDNAINACMNTDDYTDRKITLTISNTDNYLSIVCSNPFTKSKNSIHDITYDKSVIPKHGYGLLNVQDVVNKYNGVMDIDTTNNTFLITVCLKENT